MARGKALVTDLRASPPPVEVAVIPSDSFPTTSGSSTSIDGSSTCPKCQTIFTDTVIEDFRNHVASCSRPTTTGSEISSSELSPAPDSPIVDRFSKISARDDLGLGDIPLLSAKFGATDAGHQAVGHEATSDEESVDEDDEDFGDISPYVAGELIHYDVEDDQQEALAADPLAELSAAPSPGVLSVNGEAEEANPEEELDLENERPTTPDPVDAASPSAPETPMNNASSESRAASEVPDELAQPNDANSSTPKTWSTKHLAIPNALALIQASDTNTTPDVSPHRTKNSKQRWGFRELTSIEEFEVYLAAPEDMSYEKLYHRTATTAVALKTLQDEYDLIERELQDHEAAKKYQVKIATEENKITTEIEAAKDDAELVRLHGMYHKILRGPAKDFQKLIAKLESSDPPTPPETIALVRSLKNPDTMGKVNKRRKQRDKANKNTPTWVDIPLPSLRKGEDDHARKRRKLFQDATVFEDRKTADVYMADYSKHKDHIGAQILKDRRTIVASSEERDENGRPKRSRGGKRNYETDASETPAGSDAEEAPLGKRRRTARQIVDLPASPARAARKQQTRDGTPQVATFPSGKRIGRPPRAKADGPKSATKSKLQQSHLPPATEGSDSEDELAGDVEVAPKKSRQSTSSGQNIGAIQETQLQDAAEALVYQTQSDQHPAPAAKRKNAGGKTKNEVDEADLDFASATVEESPTKAKPKRKGGRVAKPKAAKGSRFKKEPLHSDHVQLGEENDIIQSTEQDDESRFASAATSRPSTSSSAATGVSAGNDRASATIDGDQGDAQGLPFTGKAGRRKPATSTTRKPAGKKVAATNDIESTKVTPEIASQSASVEPGSRPKRKTRAPLDSIFVAMPGDPDDNIIEEDTTPPAKRQKGPKSARAPRKMQAIKQEQGESEFEGDPNDHVENMEPKKRAARVGVKKILQLDSEEPEDQYSAQEDEDTAIVPGAKPKSRALKLKLVSKSEEVGDSANSENGLMPDMRGSTQLPSENPSAVQTGDEAASTTKKQAARKKRARKPAVDYNSDPEIQAAIIEAKLPAHLTEAEKEVERKAMHKSAKLSGSTAKRWRTGGMELAMNKRGETLKKKKAEKVAAAEALPGQPFGMEVDLSVPPQLAPAPAYAPPPPHPGQHIMFNGNMPPQVQQNISPYHYKGHPGSAPPPYMGSNVPPSHIQAMQYYQHQGQHQSPYSHPPPAPHIPIAPPTIIPRAAPVKKRRAPKKLITLQNITSAPSQPSRPAPPSSAHASSSTTSSTTSTRNSTRPRKPTRLVLGYDGANDADDGDDDKEIAEQFISEYDTYQALTSPKDPVTLGKRKRKSLMDLSQMRDDEDEDDFEG